jgi:hypothetical protein
MGDGYLAQDYYRWARYKVPLEGDREETYTLFRVEPIAGGLLVASS